MTERLRAALLRWEWAWAWGLGALAFMAVPVWQGGIGLSWDALNHHIYLGWTAQSPRFDRDYWAAGSQSYQFPYLYWPVYRLALWDLHGVAAGALLALLQSLAIPPVWRVARLCCPGDGWLDLFCRCAATALAFMTGVVLVMLEVTSNDLLGAIPLLWAIAWALPAERQPGQPAPALPSRAVLASGLAAGVAVGCKLSNVPLALVLPLFWLAGSGGGALKARRLGLGIAAGAAGWLLAYGYWGWQLWQHFGNPVYPLYDDLFEGARQLLGWRP